MGEDTESEEEFPCPIQHVTDEEKEIYHIGAQRKAPPYEVILTVYGQDVRMEVDTGSSVSLIARTTYERLWPERGLSPCRYKLRSYVNEPITGVHGCGSGVQNPSCLAISNCCGRGWTQFIGQKLA